MLRTMPLLNSRNYFLFSFLLQGAKLYGFGQFKMGGIFKTVN